MRSESFTCHPVASTNRFEEFRGEVRAITIGARGVKDKDKAIAMSAITLAREAFDAGDGAAAKAIVMSAYFEVFGSHAFDDGSAR